MTSWVWSLTKIRPTVGAVPAIAVPRRHLLGELLGEFGAARFVLVHTELMSSFLHLSLL
jgi:hypothetical protein